MGWKFGLNGIDNGKVSFTNVRIPRENLLNKLNDVLPDGTFKSDIKKVTNRFFKITDRLLSGRLCIASMMLTATYTCLITVIKYS